MKARDGKGQVPYDISEIGNLQKPPPVGEIVIGRVLRDRRNQIKPSCANGREENQPENTAVK